MDLMQALWQGWLVASTPEHLGWALAGCLLGTAVGVLPGLGPSAAIAVLLPLTFQVDMTAAFIFFIAIACGSMYGGSTTSILRNVPGEAASVVTAMEGHRMALNGRAGVALATAAMGSWVAGTLVAVWLLVLAPWAAGMARGLSAAEIFLLMVMAMGAVCAAWGKSTLRGLSSLWLGIALSCIGTETLSGVERLTAGQAWLQDGVDMVVVAAGLFVVAEVLHAAMYEGGLRSTFNTVGRVRLQAQDWKRSWRPWLRGTAVGLPLGCVPLGGSEMPTYISYASERYMARAQYRSEFGREGAIEGVAGPEAANNAAVTAALLPLLVMGIPTSSTTAVMLGALHNYGQVPGPHWFAYAQSLAWVLLVSLFIGNLMLWVLNWPLVRMWVWLLRIPRHHLLAAALVLALAAVYGMRQSVADVCLLYGMGLLGVAMRRFDFPMTPLVVGLALGPLAEVQLRLALAVGGGSWSVFVAQPRTLGLLVLVVALMGLPMALRGWVRRRMAQARADTV